MNKLAGLPQSDWQPNWVNATTTQDLTADGKRESYLWGKLDLVAGHYQFTLSAGSHSSANLINLAGTNALAVVPIDTTTIAAGKVVPVLVPSH